MDNLIKRSGISKPNPLNTILKQPIKKPIIIARVKTVKDIMQTIHYLQIFVNGNCTAINGGFESKKMVKEICNRINQFTR